MADLRQDRLKKLYSDKWKSRLKGFVGRKYHNFGDWEGWFEEAHQNLALKIDRLPLERDITDAMIFAVFKNELVSVKRHKLGYPRPRQWLREFSELGQDLFEWMCLQKLNRPQIIDKACLRSKEAIYSTADTHEPSTFRSLLENLIDMMIEKKECDGVRPETDQIDGESVSEIASDNPGMEEYTDNEQIKLVLSMLFNSAQVDNKLETKAMERLASMRLALKDEQLLSDMDILVLRCYYFQGMSQSEVAKLLKQPLQKVVRRREAVIKRIRGFMEDHGLDRKSLL